MRNLGLAGPEFAELTTALLDAGHALRFRARGASMSPFIRDGDVIEVRPIKATAIRCGDVILCRRGSGRVVVHRVIRVSRKHGRITLVTKGDALACPDGFIPPEQVLGQVVAIQRNGRRLRLDRGPRKWVNWLLAQLSPFSPWFYSLLGKTRPVLLWLAERISGSEGKGGEYGT